MGCAINCAACRAVIVVDFWWVVALSVFLVFLCSFFFEKGYPGFGFFVICILFTRFVVGDKFDGAVLPLRAV